MAGSADDGRHSPLSCSPRGSSWLKVAGSCAEAGFSFPPDLQREAMVSLIWWGTLQMAPLLEEQDAGGSRTGDFRWQRGRRASDCWRGTGSCPLLPSWAPGGRQEGGGGSPPSGSQKAAPSGQVGFPLCLILQLTRLPFLTGINLVLSTSWQIVSTAVALEVPVAPLRPVVVEMLSELSVCGLRCPDMLTGKTEVFSFFVARGIPSRFFGSKETLLSSRGLPCLELCRRKGKSSSSLVGSDPTESTPAWWGPLVSGAGQPAVTVMASASGHLTSHLSSPCLFLPGWKAPVPDRCSHLRSLLTALLPRPI